MFFDITNTFILNLFLTNLKSAIFQNDKVYKRESYNEKIDNAKKF